MHHNRRDFVKKAGLLGAASLMTPAFSMSLNPQIERPKVLFFDVNETLLDLRAMKREVASALQGREDLLSLWFTTMLQYSLVVNAAGHYEHFGTIGAASLQMVAANNNIILSEARAKQIILTSLRALPAHPDVKASLEALKEAGFVLVSFTNSSKQGVSEQLKNAELSEYFDRQLSVEEIQKFKPFKQTYDWGAGKMGIKPNQAMLIAAHGWDIAGALWAGWRAAFIKRPGAQRFPLAPQPEIEQTDLIKITKDLIAMR